MGLYCIPNFFFFLSVTWIDFVCNADADPGIWIQMWIQIQGVKNLTRTSFLSLWTFMVLSQRTPGLWDDCFLWKFPPVVVLASFAPTCSLLSGSKWCETQLSHSVLLQAMICLRITRGGCAAAYGSTPASTSPTRKGERERESASNCDTVKVMHVNFSKFPCGLQQWNGAMKKKV